MPLNLAPLSWQFELRLALLQGESPEETLLVALSEEHLDMKQTNSLSRANVVPMLLGQDAIFSPIGGAVKCRERDTREGVELHDELVPNLQSPRVEPPGTSSGLYQEVAPTRSRQPGILWEIAGDTPLCL